MIAPRAWDSFADERLELGAEFFDVGDVGADGAVVEGADGGAAPAPGHVEDGVEIVLVPVAVDDAMDHLVDPPGRLAAGRAPPARSMSWRSVMDTEASYTAGRFTRPDTEYMRVPPWVLVPSPANHSAPRALMAGNGGLILGQPFLPSSEDSSPVSSPQM